MNQAQRGYYSLVQLCPDDSRLEVVNVGLAVFVPDVPRVLVRWAATAKARISNCLGRKTGDSSITSEMPSVHT